MKIALILSIFILASCGKRELVPGEPSQEYHISPGAPSMEIRVIKLDGNEYYATRTTHGYWALCPKLPAKIENK